MDWQAMSWPLHVILNDRISTESSWRQSHLDTQPAAYNYQTAACTTVQLLRWRSPSSITLHIASEESVCRQSPPAPLSHAVSLRQPSVRSRTSLVAIGQLLDRRRIECHTTGLDRPSSIYWSYRLRVYGELENWTVFCAVCGKCVASLRFTARPKIDSCRMVFNGLAAFVLLSLFSTQRKPRFALSYSWSNLNLTELTICRYCAVISFVLREFI